jgi:hypothetical protein
VLFPETGSSPEKACADCEETEEQASAAAKMPRMRFIVSPICAYRKYFKEAFLKNSDVSIRKLEILLLQGILFQMWRRSYL